VKVVIGQARHRRKQKPGRLKQMIKAQLRDFMEHVVDSKMISRDDVAHLQRNILEDGISCREEAEALLALDRTVAADESWGEVLTHLMVDFVVWGARPTGYVTADDAKWLASLLDAGGPTDNALRIAYAIVDEAQQVDEALLGVILRGRQQATRVLAA
jgi:hypothetical protein